MSPIPWNTPRRILRPDLPTIDYMRQGQPMTMLQPGPNRLTRITTEGHREVLLGRIDAARREGRGVR